jgi:hypothetical protein
VVAGKYTADKVLKTEKLETVNGQSVSINTDKEGAKINMSGITATDIMTSNGVIHVIDTVLLPKENHSSAAADCEYIRAAQQSGCPAFSDKNAAEKNKAKIKYYSL